MFKSRVEAWAQNGSCNHRHTDKVPQETQWLPEEKKEISPRVP